VLLDILLNVRLMQSLFFSEAMNSPNECQDKFSESIWMPPRHAAVELGMDKVVMDIRANVIISNADL
jgi:hypothetical protein